MCYKEGWRKRGLKRLTKSFTFMMPSSTGFLHSMLYLTACFFFFPLVSLFPLFGTCFFAFGAITMSLRLEHSAPVRHVLPSTPQLRPADNNINVGKEKKIQWETGNSVAQAQAEAYSRPLPTPAIALLRIYATIRKLPHPSKIRTCCRYLLFNREPRSSPRAKCRPNATGTLRTHCGYQSDKLREPPKRATGTLQTYCGHLQTRCRPDASTLQTSCGFPSDPLQLPSKYAAGTSNDVAGSP